MRKNFYISVIVQKEACVVTIFKLCRVVFKIFEVHSKWKLPENYSESDSGFWEYKKASEENF